MSVGEIPLDEVVTWDEITNNVSTGVTTDADSTPTYSVFEDVTDTPILSAQNFTKRTSLTGNYRGTFTASAANGFEVGKWYNVISSATVNSVSAKKKSMTFRLVLAELVAGAHPVDIGYSLGTAVTNEDFTVSSASSSTVTLPTTDSAGASIPDASQLQWCALNVVGGTGKGQVVLLTTATGSARQYNIFAGTAPTQLDNTSKCIVVGSWQANTVKLGGNPVVNAGTVTYPTNATLASTTNITAGTITTVTNLTNAPTVGDFTATMKTSIVTATWDSAISGHTGAGTFGGALSAAGGAGDPWTTTLPGPYVSGQAGFIVGTNLNALITSRMASYTQPSGFLAATFPGTVASTTNITAGIITTVTNLVNAPTSGDFTTTMKTSLNAATPAVTVSDKTGFSLTTAYDFAKGTVQMTESYAVNGVAPTPIQALYAVRQYLMQFIISGTAYTVHKLDNVTTGFVVTLNNATNPTGASLT